MAEQEILTVSVSQVNNYIKRLMDANRYLSQIWIKGEISNCKRHYSGHIYLTLKDETSTLRAVMFRSAAAALPFTPENGMKVRARGRITVYERNGEYQLYIEEMQPDGVGALYMAYEQLKARLAEEGLFDERFKQPIPRYPSRIGVVTAKTGAAGRDIINVLSRRYPLADILVSPVLVQGEQAAGQIARAIAYFNETDAADVLIVGRGGGSIEDLWAFNEEIVARAIFASHIPIISAVGHEVDFTIADFVADLRAPTPSAAAEVAVPDSHALSAQLLKYRLRLGTLAESDLRRRKTELGNLTDSRTLRQFPNRLADLRLQATDLEELLQRAAAQLLHQRQEAVAAAVGKLDALSPLKVLTRGYAIALGPDGQTLKTVQTANRGDALTVRLADGSLGCTVTEITPEKQEAHNA